MGLFYTTFTSFGPDNETIVDSLRKMRRDAFVSPTSKGFTVIYDRETEEQDFDEIEKFGKTLSKVTNSPVLASVLHDDDVLYLWLFQKGECTDHYNSLPQYFDPDATVSGPPEGGDSEALCKAFGQTGQEMQLEDLLRANLLDNEHPEIPGELERHQAMLALLNMPAYAAYVTYSAIKARYVAREFENISFVRT
jgi:hypothetical protein